MEPLDTGRSIALGDIPPPLRFGVYQILKALAHTLALFIRKQMTYSHLSGDVGLAGAGVHVAGPFVFLYL